jgi:hypothetical protein
MRRALSNGASDKSQKGENVLNYAYIHNQKVANYLKNKMPRLSMAA